MSRRLHRVLPLMAMTLSLPCGLAQGAIVTVHAAGHITNVESGFGDFAFGDPFSATFAYDSDSPDFNPDDVNQGAYREAGISAEVGIGVTASRYRAVKCG